MCCTKFGDNGNELIESQRKPEKKNKKNGIQSHTKEESTEADLSNNLNQHLGSNMNTRNHKQIDHETMSMNSYQNHVP